METINTSKREYQDKMNIALTRPERILLWDLIGRELDQIKWDTVESQYKQDRIRLLKQLEILIIG
jgi:hypothetical protein